MKAFYRGHSYDPQEIETGSLRAGDVAAFRGHSFQLDKFILSASSFVGAQFRGHSLSTNNRRSPSKNRRQSNRLSRTIASLTSKRLAH